MSDTGATSTGSVSNWWDSIEVYSSDYEPAEYEAGPSVDANHALLDGLRENDFDTKDTAYTYGLLTLALVFLVAGLLACFCVPCLYACLGKSRQERLRERLQFGRKTHVTGNFVMVAASIAAIATAAGAVWGLEKADTGLTRIEGNTQDIASDLKAVLSLPNDTSTALDDISAGYDVLEQDIEDNCENSEVLLSLLDSGFDVDSFADLLEDELEDLNEETLNDLANDIQGVSDAVDTTEGLRKGVVWPAISLSILFMVAFIAIGLGTYEFVACGAADCGALSCVVTPCTTFLAVVIWLSAAAAVTLSALSGDFCTDPDTNVQTLISDSTNDASIQELLTYYTGDCSTDNFAVDAIIDAQELVVPIYQDTLPALYELADLCEDVTSSVKSLDTMMEDLWLVLENAGQLTSCENLNSLYQSTVYDNVCDELPKGLLGFWVSCALITVLLLILAIQWSRMLAQQSTEDEAERVEASGRRKGQWLSGRFSRKDLNAASSRSSRYSTRSASSSRHAPVSGSGESHAMPPTWGAGAATTMRTGSVRTGAPTQRPVEISNPHRAIR